MASSDFLRLGLVDTISPSVEPARIFPSDFRGLSRLWNVNSLSFLDVNITVFTLLLPNRGCSFSDYLLRHDRKPF